MTAEERFWSFVEKGDGCWLWKGKTSTGGYGRFHVGGRTVGAHRFIFEETVAKRPLRRTEYVCHHCDNPSCVRPAHLFKGNAFTNIQDAIAKKRMPRCLNTKPFLRFVPSFEATALNDGESSFS
jgi:hypothetical protein